MVVTALCAASSLFVLPAVWAKQIGFEIPYAPIQIVLSRLDFIITLVITWAVFRWRAQGFFDLTKSLHATRETHAGEGRIGEQKG
jgi:hypothetical protein